VSGESFFIQITQQGIILAGVDILKEKYRLHVFGTEEAFFVMPSLLLIYAHRK